MSFAENGPGEMSLGAEDRAAAVAEVKRTLRLASDDDDTLIAAFAETALGLAERFLGRVLIARSMTETLDGGRAWQALGAMPVRSITGVSSLDEIGAPTALPVDAYAIDVDASGTGWVRADLRGRIAVDYVAGGATEWGGIPAPVRQGAVLLAAHLYDQRDANVPPPAAVTALWRPFRVLAIDRERRAC
jgi:uncharacterized phiE125 gp8 family phage protein